MKFDPSIVQARYQSPLGSIIIAATGKGLAGLWFEGQRHLPQELVDTPEPTPVLAPSSAAPIPASAARTGGLPLRRAGWPSDPEHPVLKRVCQQLGEYFAGQRSRFEVPLDLAYGTAFQQSVWQALLTIPQGETASYSDISARIGKPAAVRAVGAAVGRNPVSILVPCHRVIGAHGSLTGYAGGLDRKAALLKLEGLQPEHRL